MNTLSIVLVMVFLVVLVIIGLGLSISGGQHMRKMVTEKRDSGLHFFEVSRWSLPPALGICFTIFGFAGIGRIIGFDGMAAGTWQIVGYIAIQSIPAVLITFIVYMFYFKQRHV